MYTFAKGDKIASDNGESYRYERVLSAGGQGEVHVVTDPRSRSPLALKLFNESHRTRDTAKRVRFLTGEELEKSCSVLKGPLRPFRSRHGVGYVASWSEGEPMDGFLASGLATFGQCLQAAAALAHAVAELHVRGIAHGDLQDQNILLWVNGDVVEVSVIDMDNFHASDQPKPPCKGQLLYMAPEIRNDGAMPSIPGDLFALGILMHELLLLFHPFLEEGMSSDEFHQRVSAGCWTHPDHPRSAGAGGYPVGILDSSLSTLLRRALHPDPANRPAASDWRSALNAAMFKVYECGGCGCPIVIDTSKTLCPGCGEPYPKLRISTHHGYSRVVDGGSVPMGRADLGSNKLISRRQAIFRRIGPETYVECCGVNPTQRKTPGGWIALPQNKPVLLRAGDRLRFADDRAAEIRLTETT
jgi:serine/threonine protein kinase